jgi:hypothetical protein
MQERPNQARWAVEDLDLSVVGFQVAALGDPTAGNGEHLANLVCRLTQRERERTRHGIEVLQTNSGASHPVHLSLLYVERRLRLCTQQQTGERVAEVVLPVDS